MEEESVLARYVQRVLAKSRNYDVLNRRAGDNMANEVVPRFSTETAMVTRKSQSRAAAATIKQSIYMTNFKKSSHSNGAVLFASVPLPFRFRFASVMRVMSTSLSKDSKVLWKYSLESFR